MSEVEKVIEVLETDQMEILNMAAQGKYIEHMQAENDLWQNNLKAVSNVLDYWQKLQKDWYKLEPIFMHSADIKANLHETAKKFEGVNDNFKAVVEEFQSSETVIEACVVDGRVPMLKEMIGLMNECKRELDAYLDEKKKKFPRFYFIANQTLLDILSKGNNPAEVAKYMMDCFCGLKTVKFESEGSTFTSGMISVDAETVPWF